MSSENLMKIHFGGDDTSRFDDPFMLPSSDYIPENLESALDFLDSAPSW